jgi:hypothetical protein
MDRPFRRRLGLNLTVSISASLKTKRNGYGWLMGGSRLCEIRAARGLQFEWGYKNNVNP